MNSASIVSKVWSFCTTLRDDGVGYGDYLEQLTYLIFLKMADEYARPPYRRDVGIPVRSTQPFHWGLRGGRTCRRERTFGAAQFLAGILEPGRHSWRMNLAAALDVRCKQRVARTAAGTAARRGGPSGSVRALARGILPAVARE